MLRLITKPRLSMLDGVLTLVCALAQPFIGWWFAFGLLILLIFVSSAIERRVWK